MYTGYDKSPLLSTFAIWDLGVFSHGCRHFLRIVGQVIACSESSSSLRGKGYYDDTTRTNVKRETDSDSTGTHDGNDSWYEVPSWYEIPLDANGESAQLPTISMTARGSPFINSVNRSGKTE